MTDNSAGPAPELVTVEEAVTAVVRGVVPTAGLPDFFDASFGELARTLTAQQVAIAGPAFAFYREPPGQTADLEVGFTTDAPVREEGRVVAASLPGTRVARLVHHGAFDRLGSSWERLLEWTREQGLTPGAGMWEVYLTEPSPEMDPDDLRTELNLPVIG